MVSKTGPTADNLNFAKLSAFFKFSLQIKALKSTFVWIFSPDWVYKDWRKFCTKTMCLHQIMCLHRQLCQKRGRGGELVVGARNSSAGPWQHQYYNHKVDTYHLIKSPLWHNSGFHRNRFYRCIPIHCHFLSYNMSRCHKMHMNLLFHCRESSIPHFHSISRVCLVQ